MKRNIILLYIVYLITVSLLLVIDTAIFMYYIFWINNIFIYPLLWLWLKIVYYNRTVLLLLLFYYLIAKYTIKEQGYKYFLFFNIDIRAWRSLYLNYIWNITTYHIEIISIYLFFFAIIIPLYLYNKALTLLVCCLFLFFFYFLKIIKNRLKYLGNIDDNKKKKLKLRSLIFFPVFMYYFLKMFNHFYLKDIITLYMHLDIWTFDLLEWKIQMYNKATEKDYYSKTVGLKPIWIGEKIKIKDYINNKYWDYLCKKKNKKLINELKFKLKKVKKKYFLYFKYYDKFIKVKKDVLYAKKRATSKYLFWPKRDLSLLNYLKEYTPKKNTKNENPVVTQEKERERALHRTLVTNKMLNFSIKNYYNLNEKLKLLTFDKLYYQPFFDKKGLEKHLTNEKKGYLYSLSKNRISVKNDIFLYKEIIVEIKKNKVLLKKLKIYSLLLDYKDTKNIFFLKNLLNYLNIKKENENVNVIKKKDLLNIKKTFNKSIFNDINFYKKKENNMTLFLKKTKNDIKLKKKLNQLTFFFNSKKNILNYDKINDSKKKTYNNLTFNYIEKSEVEKFDNKLLFNTVKKYNEEKSKLNWKTEFSKSFVLKEKKGSLKSSDSPDLSRRNRK